MTGRLDGKVVIITGAASGIGLASAQIFAEEGARLVLGDIDADRLHSAVEQIAAAGGQAVGRQTDVSDPEEVAALVDTAIERFGQLNVMFSNAGISARQSIVEMEPETFDRVIDINLRGAFLCAKYAIPHLARAGGGSIIFTASELAFVGASKAAAYCASKSALLGLSRAIALDHAPDNVRCNCLCPGPVDTPLLWGEKENPEEYAKGIAGRMPFGRIARPDELARAAVFLASDESSFVTGTSLLVDGGVTAKW
jgi:NAD(P)-dependent dehydrogenase (short-subunit alcohol dehydrogenase family)